MLGLDGLAHFVPREDADVVRAIKGAGALVFGKNNLVEMSYGLTGHNARYGQVKNPVARDRVSGGSSSGSAASVAANIVPSSLGGDTVGSIRVPASLCGVVGFKPTTGRWPRNGVAPISHTLARLTGLASQGFVYGKDEKTAVRVAAQATSGIESVPDHLGIAP